MNIIKFQIDQAVVRKEERLSQRLCSHSETGTSTKLNLKSQSHINKERREERKEKIDRLRKTEHIYFFMPCGRKSNDNVAGFSVDKYK